MKRFSPRSIARSALILSLMAAAFGAGMAQSADENVARMNQAHDLLTKTQAVLNAVATRKGYGDVENAKKNVAKALVDIEKAVKANGG